MEHQSSTTLHVGHLGVLPWNFKIEIHLQVEDKWPKWNLRILISLPTKFGLNWMRFAIFKLDPKLPS